MGQYHKIFNLTKSEFVNPHALGCGLKAMEQAWIGPERGGGTMAALFLLMLGSCKGGPRGGGDCRTDVGGDIVGRWCGDQIAILGDYMEQGDAGSVALDAIDFEKFTDISEQVRELLQEQYGGVFEGSGWMRWRQTGGGR
jgi:hypothetical protein